MKPPALLIITGHPATGKTTLARGLAALLAAPLISKDALKETMFDTLGWSDQAWARQVGVAAIALLYQMTETLLAAGCSLIVESNFRPDLDSRRLGELRARHPFRLAQLRCVASGPVMAERYLRRIRAGERHLGHAERPGPEEERMMRGLGQIEPLALDGPLLTVDTTEPDSLDLAAIHGWCRAALDSPPRAAAPPGPP